MENLGSVEEWDLCTSSTKPWGLPPLATLSMLKGGGTDGVYKFVDFVQKLYSAKICEL